MENHNHNLTRSSAWWLKACWFATVITAVFWVYFREHGSSTSRKIENLAELYSSIDIFERTPVINHEGDLLGLMHSTTKGMGVFIADLETRKEQAIFEVKSSDYLNDYSRYDPDAYQIFGWSQDDRTFAFFWKYTLQMVTNGVDSTPVKTLDNGINSFAWITPEKIAFIDDTKKLAVLNNETGDWKDGSSWQLPETNGFPRNLTAINSHSVAWTTDNGLWQMDLQSGDIQSIYFDLSKHFSGFSYCSNSDSFLLLETMHVRRAYTSTLLAITGLTNISVLKEVNGELVDKVQWLDSGSGYAYSSQTSFVAKTEAFSTGQELYQGQVYGMFYNMHGSTIYLLASKTNSAPGIWACDLDSKSATCLFSPWGFQTKEAHYQPVITESAPYGKHFHPYSVIQPVHFSRQKKYPLIIAMDSYYWTGTAQATYAQFIANCGAAVAISGYRYHAEDNDLESYTNILTAIYDQLSKSPNIDRDQVYLFAPSSASVVLNDLLVQFPKRWRGVFFAGPIAILQPETATSAHLVFTAGESEKRVDLFRNRQVEYCKFGTWMEWHIYPNEGHIERCHNTMLEQERLLGKFIFNQ